MSHHPRHVKTLAPHTSTAEPKSLPGEPDARGEQPAADCIRLRAYEISQTRKGGPGNALSDWIQAEQELQAGTQAAR